jgi:signal peptide peptidase SppA
VSDFQRVPHIDQYEGVWAMYEPTFQLLYEQAMRMDITAHMTSERVQQVIDEVNQAGSAEGSYRTTIRNGVAVIRANGTLMKQASSFSAGTSTVLLRQSLMAAMRDESVNAALLAIESPGGTAAGTYELAETISRFAKQKPIITHIEDLGASAAYWIASATQSISANAPAKVGSVGTYMVIQDLSAMAAKEGVKVHVVRAGSEHKGAGVPGTEITPAQLAEFQRHVNRTNDFFVAGVAAGRKMTEVQVRQLADGRVHGAEEAKQLGLIDHVRTFEESFDEAVALASRKTQVRVRGTKMTAIETSAATPKEIKAACTGASSDFVLQSIEAERTLDQCRDAFIQDQATEIAALREQNETLVKERDEAIEKANAASTKTVASQTGAEPLIDSPKSGKKASGESASDAFWASVKAEEAEGKSRQEALAAVNRSNPELREAMLAEARLNYRS